VERGGGWCAACLVVPAQPLSSLPPFQTQGNDALKRGLQVKKRFYVAEAVSLYDKGLAEAGIDTALRVALLANRAQAHLTLGNDRRALVDAGKAAEMDPGHVKARHRGARAAARLREWDAAESALAAGLTASPGEPALVALQAEVAKLRAADEAAAAAAAAAAHAARAPARALALALAARGVAVGPPQASVGALKPWLDGGGTVHWPLLFVYPEAGGARDAVEDAAETDTMAAHLAAVLDPGAPPLPWDGERKYRPDTVDLYILANAVAPLPPAALIEALHGAWPDGVAAAEPGDGAAWVEVDPRATVADVAATPGCAVPGVPVLFVLARGTPYGAAFRARMDGGR